MRQGDTAVMLAASEGHVTCLQPLIDAKCDLNKADEEVTSSTNKVLYAMYVCCAVLWPMRIEVSRVVHIHWLSGLAMMMMIM